MALRVVTIKELKEIASNIDDKDANINLTLKPLYSGVLHFRSYSKLSKLYKSLHKWFRNYKDVSVQVKKDINLEVTELTYTDIIKGALDLTEGDVIYLYDETKPTPGKKVKKMLVQISNVDTTKTEYTIGFKIQDYKDEHGVLKPVTLKISNRTVGPTAFIEAVLQNTEYARYLTAEAVPFKSDSFYLTAKSNPSNYNTYFSEWTTENLQISHTVVEVDATETEGEPVLQAAIKKSIPAKAAVKTSINKAKAVNKIKKTTKSK